MSPGIRDVHHHTQLNPFSIQSFNPDLTGNLPCPRSYKASFQVPPMMLILNNKILGGAFDNHVQLSQEPAATEKKAGCGPKSVYRTAGISYSTP